MLQRLHITNYRSIADATVDLRPFTLLVGANGSGKSNFLRLLEELGKTPTGRELPLRKHFNREREASAVDLEIDGKPIRVRDTYGVSSSAPELFGTQIFSIDPSRIGGAEQLLKDPVVRADGSGSIAVLDSLKTGDREDLFDQIERELHEFVPEIEKLSFVPGDSVKSLQVRERDISVPVPVSQLSEGTRLVLTMLVIVHQVRRPPIICIEDLDRGIHPRLFGQVVRVCRTLSNSGCQIIATTHNPYLVDEFAEDTDAVVVVEKISGETRFTSLTKKLADQGLAEADEPVGNMWYSGLVGGVPTPTLEHLRRANGK